MTETMTAQDRIDRVAMLSSRMRRLADEMDRAAVDDVGSQQFVRHFDGESVLGLCIDEEDREALYGRKQE